MTFSGKVKLSHFDFIPLSEKQYSKIFGER
jgi:hypothetical protein